LHALREAREHRRLLQKILADFERGLVASPPRPAVPSLADLFPDQTAAA
jgi:hypothetical protein